MTPGHEAWVQDWVGRHHGQLGRLRLHAQQLSELAPTASAATAAPGLPGLPDTQLLARARLALRRFDCCVIPVAPASLSWVRTALANAGTEPRTPLVPLVFDITAPAILDLLALGAADFVRAPACPDELRARLMRLCRASLSMAERGGPGSLAGPSCAVREPVLSYGARPGPRRAN
ncbi:MAG TPA: hypothetical protein VEA17_04400, partial [Bordetella sp.]|nr:hypothetical protein [Bordetella sp.]